MRRFGIMSHLPGSLILPRAVADGAQRLWPKCARCMRAVDAYGIENETSDHIEVWARCDGIRWDPDSGRALPGSVPVHRSMKTSFTLKKGLNWTPNTFAEIVSKMALFAPSEVSEGRDFDQIHAGEHTVKAS